MAVISKGITLAYKTGAPEEADYMVLEDLQEIPAMGGETESIEITTLADAAHMYTNGIKSYGDSLGFTFLYDKAQFDTLNKLEGSVDWKVTLPDEAACTFSGTCSVQLNGVGVNDVLTYVLAIKPDSEMIWA